MGMYCVPRVSGQGAAKFVAEIKDGLRAYITLEMTVQIR